MDRRSWPWKKKSSDKAAVEKEAAAFLDSASASLASAASLGDQDSYKKPTYVQISVESYSHLTGLEDQVKAYADQVKTLEDQIQELNEKLSEAHSDMTTKDNLVKQHAKVAEEAVSGWEKAEAEALSLKNHLESVTLLKLTAEDRASHLDGALKECMRQIRNLKEEHELKLHKVVLTNKEQWDKVKLELESKIAEMDQELLKSAAENAALFRSLQDRSNMVIKLSEENSQAEAEIERMKSNIESCEREINSLKYEFHVVTKELEIRNEEKNMSVKSAEVANKQHLEGVKKITKLEAECQRLRGLVRKKLPGPAAMAQMKLEVENLGRDQAETRLRRSPVKPSLPELSLDSVQKFHKENELLTERLLAMEEETKMLKEALAKRNSELQASRSVCAKTVSKLQSLEAKLQVNNQNAGSPPSLTSMSEDGNDDEVSCSGSWATSLVSESSHLKKEKSITKSNKVENATHSELMDDFLEMEKLANVSNDTNNKSSEIVNRDGLVEVTAGTDFKSKEQPELDSPGNHASPYVESSALDTQSDIDPQSLLKLQSRISMVFESISKDADLENVLEDIRHVVQETHDSLHQQRVISLMDCETCPEEAEVTEEKEISLSHDINPSEEKMHSVSHELAAAISKIHDFVLVLGKEAIDVHVTSPDGDGLSQKFNDFSVNVFKVINSELSLVDFVFELSHVLTRASELHFNVLGYKNSEAETNGSDCIDKVALPENKMFQNSSGERYINGCARFSDSTSDPDIPQQGSFIPSIEFNAPSWKCSLEEFEQLKLEKDNMVIDLARCTEELESTKSQLAEVKSQLASAQKLNSLADTQLKCMAESYKFLETRAEELQTEVNLLRGRTESLGNELKEERKSHQDALARCKDLQEHLHKIESQLEDTDMKTSQERELAEKLAECQETIYLLGKQLKAMHPQTEFMGSPYSERSFKGESLTEEEQDLDQAEMDSNNAPNSQRAGGESPMAVYNSPFSPSDLDSNSALRSPISSRHPKHRSTNSGSSSSSSTPTPEKHLRGFSRFFSSKGKNGELY